MKKMIEVEAIFCDICEKQTFSCLSCNNCGKDFCEEHTKYETVKYFSDPYSASKVRYCNECNKKLIEDKDPLIMNYLTLDRLILNREKYYEETKNQMKSIMREIEILKKGK